MPTTTVPTTASGGRPATEDRTRHAAPSGPDDRAPDTAPARPRRRPPLWAVPAAVLVAVLVSLVLPVPPVLHQFALFLHLAFLVIGLGAVLAVDWLGLLWLGERMTLPEMLRTTSRLTPLIWIGLGGLISTGALLSPDPTSALTATKLGLVAVLGVNGALAARLHPRLEAAGDRPPGWLLLAGLVQTGVSQLAWWGATVIGLLNAQS